MNILFFVAHDKLSVKFKEIAEGSKKLSVNDSHEPDYHAIRSKLERKQCVYGTKEKMESLDYSEDKSDSDKSSSVDPQNLVDLD
ncbi:unnamed protein product [Rhizophagus irregularis]|nr:unnamed protein product [Rhizophagus irregularis]CAB4434836.1 unnamed protein product [Rhizophagus irregularis]